MATAPWESDPVVDDAAAPVPDPAAPAAAPDGAAPWATDSQAAPEDTGFTDEQKRQILAYIPKATDAADLERYSLELSGGKSKIGNAAKVLDDLKKGHKVEDFAFTPPTISKDMAPKPEPASIRDTIGDAMLNSLDVVIPGLGTFLAANRDSGKAFTEHAANAAAFDYGPEVGGVIDTLLHGGSVANNAAHERAMMEGDSEGHPIASSAGELAGVAVPAILGNEAGLANLPKALRALVTTGEGAAYGSGAAGPDDRAVGGVTGGALGAATEAAAPFVAKFVAATKAGDTAAAAAVAKAAHDLGIDLPRFIVGGPAAARKASALEQTVGGARPISEATARMLDEAEAARTGIASAVGTAAEPAAMGDQTLDAAVRNMKGERKRIGRIYDQARDASDNVGVPPTQTMQTLAQLIRNERQVPGGTKALPILEHYAGAFENGGPVSIDGARGMRTELRSRLRDEAGMTPDNADRVTNLIMSSVGDDIENGLKSAGKNSAIPLYRKADAQWAAQRSTEDDVLRPFLGKNFDAWGEDVAKKINSDAKGNGTRLARFLAAVPDEQANAVRASLITRLGTATDGAQNAAGDAFSLDRFLTNWNQLKGSRNLIFPKETVQSLDKLAQIADAVKAVGRTKNRSNTGSVVSYVMGGLPTLGGAAETMLTGDPKGVAIGMLASALNTVRQYRAAKLLASPAFARKLAATPLHPTAARAFWSRSWVKNLEVKNPAIAAEIQTFQKAILSPANDNAGTLSSAAAEPQEQD